MDDKTLQQLADKWEKYLESLQPTITQGQGGSVADFKFADLTMSIPRGVAPPTRKTVRVR